MLKSIINPVLNLKNPKSAQLFSLCPQPTDFSTKKKSFTTPSGNKVEINKLNIVPNSIPIINTVTININDLVFKYIIPEYNILNSFKKNINPLRSLNTSFSKRGISLFIENILLLNDFTKDNLYKINFYINLLENYSIVLSQNDFFINNYDKDKIIQQISIDNFIGIDESSNIFKRINTNEFYIEDMIVFLHLLNLYEKHCVINSTLNVNEYIDNILSKGSVPFYLIDGK